MEIKKSMTVAIMNKFKLINALFTLDQLIKLTSQKLILPFYHTISDQRLPHISNLYQIRTIKQFEQDLDYLCRHYQPVSIQELFDIVHNNKTITKPIFHLTFDDGLKELYTIVAPILERKGIPATIFINTEFVDNKALFYRYKVSLLIEKMITQVASRKELSAHLGMTESDTKGMKDRLLSLNHNDSAGMDEMAKRMGCDFDEFLETNQPYLTKSQIKELTEKGFSIGSHSLNHPYFKDIDLNEKKRQIKESFNYLEKELNIKDFYFSYPFSDDSVESDFFIWLFNSADCKLSFGISGLKHDCSKYHVHRIPFEQGSTRVKEMVKGEYLYYIAKSLFKKNTIIRP
jgi:peptidoglycan/xylan/chitin deacetylase (PgdA/CDA1 family)